MTREEAELCRLAETRFRRDRDDRTQRCPCSAYRSEMHKHYVRVRCVTSSGLTGCGFEVWYPLVEIEKYRKASA